MTRNWLVKVWLSWEGRIGLSRLAKPYTVRLAPFWPSPKLYSVNQTFIFWPTRAMAIYRGCLALLYELCSTNSTIEQLHKKLEFVEYLFRCSTTIFSRTECVELKLFS